MGAGATCGTGVEINVGECSGFAISGVGLGFDMGDSGVGLGHGVGDSGVGMGSDTTV